MQVLSGCVFLVAVLVHGASTFSIDDSDRIYQERFQANPGARKTRGNKFALAFMNNRNRQNVTTSQTKNEIGLFITTEQESSTFTIQTRFAGVDGRGFTETSSGSGLYTRTEIATRGSFTFVSLPAGGGTVPDIAVQNNGQNSVPDQRKGVIIEAANSTHELTIYVLNDEDVSTDAYMAINCVEFPSASNYQYFVFSSDYAETGGNNFQSRFLITPCEDDTEVTVRPSLTLSHPAWVSPSLSSTFPDSTTGQDKSTYGRLFNRFDTLMLDANDDLTGSIIISDKPLSVFVGHECGTPVDVRTCNYLVEQVPPHPTYGDLFFMAPFAVRQSGELYKIGSITNETQVTITCNCMADSGSGNRAALENSTLGVYTATVNRGEYVQCRTPQNMQSYCCVQSTQPVTMMSYTLGNKGDDLENLPNLPFDPIADPAMVYIPPVINYLNSYSLSTNMNLTTQFQGFVSYILPERIFSNSTEDRNRLTMNGDVYIPEDGYTAINCRVDGSSDVCAYGATRYLGQGNFEIDYTNIGTGAFWGFAYGYAQQASFAYPLAFEMEPVGLAWVIPQNHIVLESYTTVNMDFRITRGGRSEKTRAFAYTEGGSATQGVDYVSAGTRPGGGDSNLRWKKTRNTPNNDLTVTILDDDVAEPVEVVEIQVECEAKENCYTPLTTYTITIVDDQGSCTELTPIANASITYNYDFEPPFPRRPYGTIATYNCSNLINESKTRTCVNGTWKGTEPTQCDFQTECEPSSLGTNVRQLCMAIPTGTKCGSDCSPLKSELCLDRKLSLVVITNLLKFLDCLFMESFELTCNQLHLITSILEELSDSEVATSSPEVRDRFLQIIDDIQRINRSVLVECQGDMNTSTRILISLETFLNKLNLTQNSTSSRLVLPFTTFAVQLEDVDIDSFEGQRFSVALGSVEQARNISNEPINQNNLITENGVFNITGNDFNVTTGLVQLTQESLRECQSSQSNSTSQRLSYFVFLTDALFLPENLTTSKVGSIVVSAKTDCPLAVVSRPSRGKRRDSPISFGAGFCLKYSNTSNTTNVSCAAYGTSGGFGEWKTEGCEEINRDEDVICCDCTQPGHFGILLSLNPTGLPPLFSLILSIVSYIGLAISLLCLTVFIFTNLVSKKLRANPHNHILVNMSLSLGGLYITFIAGGFPTNIPPLCGVVSALLHFFFLAFFAWTAVEAVWLYLKLVKVFGAQSLTRNYTLKAGIPAWVLSAVIVGISAGVGHQYYTSRFYCRPTEWPFFFGLILPFLAVYVFNWIMFFVIMVSICRHTRHMNSHEEVVGVLNARDLKKDFGVAMCLAVVLGLGWGFGLTATSSNLKEHFLLTFIFELIFSVFVGIQGVLIFILHGLRNADFRDFWKCHHKKHYKFSSTEKILTAKTASTDHESYALSSSPGFSRKESTVPTE